MTLLFRPILGVALLALVTSMSLAQTSSPLSDEPDAANGAQPALADCRPDLSRLCPDAKGAKRSACLKDNAAKLSPECSAAYAELEAKAKAMREACANDVKAHCTGTQGGQGVVQCLRTNATKLSQDCISAIITRFGKI